MNRLTEKKREFDGTAISKENLVEQGLLTEYCSKMITKLAAYEDAEEQGLLLRLPCKEGTEIYEIEGVIWKGYDWKYPSYEKAYIRKTIFTIENLKSMGRTRFLTHEEAEAKLKKLQKEKAEPQQARPGADGRVG